MRKYLTLKSILISLFIGIGLVFIYFPFLEIYLRPVKTVSEYMVSFTPNLLVLLLIGLYVLALIKRL